MFLIDVAETGRIALLSRPKFASVVTGHYYQNIDTAFNGISRCCTVT